MKQWLLLAVVCVVLTGILGSVAMAQSPWTLQTSGTTQTLRGLKVVDANVIWATGMLGVVLRTVNGGTTWQLKAAPDPAYDNYVIEALDSTTAWVFGTDDNTSVGAKIWKTTNGGSTWVEQYANANSFGDGLRFFDANNGIAVGDAEPASKSRMVVITTSNGGTTWTPVPRASVPAVDSAADELSATNQLDLTGDIAWFATYGNTDAIHPRVFKSTDKGLTWTASQPIPIDNSYGFSMRDATHGIMSNINSGSIARTTNAWASADSILIFNGDYGLRAIDWIPGTDAVVVVGGPTGSGISGVSTDGGVTWTQKTVPTGVGRLRHTQFLDVSTGWAVGNSGAILKWTGGSVLNGIDEPTTAVPTAFALNQNYPNPFNPTTIVSYQLPVASSVRLTVYDMLGREIAVLVDGEMEPGTHQVTFDGSALSSGVYFYTMKAGAFSSTKSLMLMK
jgi:photosystem II stability/assembly factor-like uncharacterized protein